MTNRKKLSVNEVDKRYKPTYHPSVPAGWANDPNGMIWYRNRAHLFFQHYPYDTAWGPMHWGHLTSKDLIRWEEQPIALQPDQWCDNELGCFSGTAIEAAGKLYLMYTGALKFAQQQCLAVSDDGIHFKKCAGNPVIGSDALPEDVDRRNFRDPKVFCRDGVYYCLAGVNRNGWGDILLYRSENLEQWQYVGNLMEPNDRHDHQAVNGVFECPDYHIIDGQEILLCSPQEMQPDGIRFQNSQVSVWMAGSLNLETGKFTYDTFHELDQGFDFYAPQAMVLPDGRTILIAWKEMWNRDFPTAKDNWAGSFTLPRELSWHEGHLYQKPIREIEGYRHNRVAAQNVEIPADGSAVINGICGNRVELNLTIEPGDALQAGVKLFKGSENETLIYYDREFGCLIFDRSKSGTEIKGRETNTTVRKCPIEMKDTLSLRIFLDVSCVEVFLQDGHNVMTGNIYADPERDLGIEFYCRGGSAKIRNVEKFDIFV